MIAKELITDTIVPLKPDNTWAFALASMDELRLSHLPVVSDKNYLGLVTEKELLALQDPGLEINTNLASLNRVSIEEFRHVYDAIATFSGMNLTLLPVVNDRNQYLGAITMETLVKGLSTVFGIRNPGGLIVLEINSRDYSLSEIVQIIESNDTKILSLYTTFFPESTRMEVTIKVNRMEIGPLLQAFNRYNYLVKASWSMEDAYSEGLQDRFDALMNYLSI